MGGGSAGSVLRSQGTLGPAGLSRCRAKGIRMSTFLCSLRPDPAAAAAGAVGVAAIREEDGCQGKICWWECKVRGLELVGFRCSDPAFETWKGAGFGFESVDEHVVA